MHVFEKLFGGLKMSWPFVVVFGIMAGIYTGIMASVPALAETSFHDIAVSLECWVIFAFIIAANCKKSWESALKIFVFFVISQPLCFLTEVFLGTLTPDLAVYYYSAIWGPATLLTLPGGFIAFYIGKQNALGCIILGLGNTIQAIMGLSYLKTMLATPPFHLLTVIICFGSIIVMTLAIQKSTKNRILTFAVVLVATLAILVLAMMTGRVL